VPCTHKAQSWLQPEMPLWDEPCLPSPPTLPSFAPSCLLGTLSRATTTSGARRWRLCWLLPHLRH
jgi:hypothetical protein